MKYLIIKLNEKIQSLGKKVMNDIYIHKSLLNIIDSGAKTQIDNALRLLPFNYKYDVIKYNLIEGNTTFIECPDFDIVDEPKIVSSIKITANGNVGNILKGSTVYHRKYEMVSDNYSGFNIQEMKDRVKHYEPLLKQHNIPKTKIGNYNYWQYVKKLLNI